MSRPAAALAIGIAAILALAPLGAQERIITQSEDARAALDLARLQQRNASARGERLEKRAAEARLAADRALAKAAALAARVQQGEARLAESEARLALARADRRQVEKALAREQAPLAELVGALETLARRPVTLAVFQRGTLTDLVHTRAVLEGTAPLVEGRTRDLRRALARLNALELESRRALADRRAAQGSLDLRRRDLTALAESQRLVARRASGAAGREAARAQILAEQAHDLDELVGRLEQAGTLRARLALLPGPQLRPADPARPTPALPAVETASPAAPPAPYLLPVDGRVVAGFGDSAGESGIRRAGLTLAPRAGAQVVAPGAGRIAFAGPYRGYGQIVIVEHDGEWTSLITGLASATVGVGQSVTAGSPLGRAPAGLPQITLELRRKGEPVNPLDLAR